MKIFLLIIFISNCTIAQITKDKTQSNIKENKITLTLEKGFHFNDKAPASIYFNQSKDKKKLDVVTEQKIEMAFETKDQQALVKYYVCDDAKTVCEPNELNLDLKNNKKMDTSYKQPVDKKLKNQNYKKTTLLIFTAPWCPPCQRMKTETYIDQTVKNQFKKIDVRFLNRDLAENADIADQFKIQFIPTLVLVDTKGAEIRRWMGFQPAQTFSEQLKAEIKTPLSIEKILKLKEPIKPNYVSKLIRHYSSNLDWDNVLLWTNKSTNLKDKPYGQQAQIEKLKDKDDTESKKQILHLLKIFSEDTEIDEINRAFFISDFYEELKDQKQSVDSKKINSDSAFLVDLKNNKKLQDLFMNSERFDYFGFEKIKIISILISLNEINKSSDNIKNLKQELKTALDSKPLDMIATGSMLDLADYYEQIGDDQKVEHIYTELIKTHPNTYVFYDNYAYYLLTKKRYKEALDQADKATQYPEGNELTLALRKAEAMAGLKQKDEALKIISHVESESNLYPERLKKRLEKKIKKIKDSL